MDEKNIIKNLGQKKYPGSNLALGKGYHSFNGELTHTIINGLLGLPNPFIEKFDSLSVSVTSSEKIHKILAEKITQLKKLLLEYHSI